MPISQSRVFISKFILAWIYLIGASAILFISILVTIKILTLFDFDGGPIVSLEIIEKILYSCIASLAVLTIQHLVSWRWQNIVAPLGLGVLATFSVMQFSSSKFWLFNPWTYTLMTTNASNMEHQSQAIILSLIISIFVLCIGLFWSKHREITC